MMSKSSSESQVTTVEQAIDQAIALEHEAEAIYRRWQEAFADYPPIVSLWEEYADEERRHAQILEGIRQRLPAEQRKRPAGNNLCEALRMAHALLERQSQNPETVGEALEVAVTIESSEINSVLAMVVEHFAPDLAGEMIHAQLREHVARLETRLQSLDQPTRNLKAVW